MQLMAPPKKSAAKKKDRNKHSVWGLRIPMPYRRQMAKIAELNRRKVTEEVKIAIEEYLAKRQLWPPTDD